jgi:hypothetical protein
MVSFVRVLRHTFVGALLSLQACYVSSPSRPPDLIAIFSTPTDPLIISVHFHCECAPIVVERVTAMCAVTKLLVLLVSLTN